MADVAELTPKELDFQRMIAAEVHIGTKIATDLMKDYVWVRRHDSAYCYLRIVASRARCVVSQRMRVPPRCAQMHWGRVLKYSVCAPRPTATTRLYSHALLLSMLALLSLPPCAQTCT